MPSHYIKKVGAGQKKNMLNYKEIGYMATQYEGSRSYADCVKQAIIDEVIHTDLDSEGIDTIVSVYNMYCLDRCYYNDVWRTFDELMDIIDNMTPEQAFRIGSVSEFSYADDYYRFNGYGNVESATDTKVKKEILQDSDFLDWCFDCQNYDQKEIDKCVDELRRCLALGY